MALVICPRCETLLKVHKVSENFLCRCGVELEHPDKFKLKEPRYEGKEDTSTARNIPSETKNPIPKPSANSQHTTVRPPVTRNRVSEPVLPRSSQTNVPTIHTSTLVSSTPSVLQSVPTGLAEQISRSLTAPPSSPRISNRRNIHNGSMEATNTVVITPPPPSEPISHSFESYSASNYSSVVMESNSFDTTYSHVMHERTNTAPGFADSTFSTVSRAEREHEIHVQSHSSSEESITHTDRTTTGGVAEPLDASNTVSTVGDQNEENKCHDCKKKFKLLSNRKKLCRSCNSVVCGSCSRGKWPAQMLPKQNNPKNEKSLRVCNACQTRTEEFRAALLKGDLAKSKSVLGQGVVHLYVPYQIYPFKLYPIHCAVLSGNLELVQWLVSQRCNPRVVDARGWSALTIAANEGFAPIVKFLIFRGFCKVSEITDVQILQKTLQTAMIELQRNDIEKNLKRYVSTQEIEGKNEMFVPKNPLEEEEQLRLALKISEGLTETSAHHGYGETTGDVKHIKVVNYDQQVIEQTECVVCFERSVDCVLVPCGHMSCCNECGTKFDECPVCRQKVKQVVKTFRT